MSLHPTARAREKILLAGPWGSGKSYARNRLINTLRASGSTARVYVLDTDDTMDRAIDAYGDEFMSNVEWRYVNAWEDWLDASKDFAAKITADDWLVVDRIDLAWERAQDNYIRRVYGVDSGEFFLQYAAENANNPRAAPALAGAHGQKWDVIKRSYAQFIVNVAFPRTTLPTATYGHPGHVLACTGIKAIGDDDDPAIVEDFRRFGGKPAGEKNLPSQFHTVIMLNHGPPWVLNTAREREGREYVSGMQLHDFVAQYLIGVGKWEIGAD